MPKQIFEISMPPEAKPLGSKQVQSALQRMIQDFEYQVMELCAIPEEMLHARPRNSRPCRFSLPDNEEIDYTP